MKEETQLTLLQIAKTRLTAAMSGHENKAAANDFGETICDVFLTCLSVLKLLKKLTNVIDSDIDLLPLLTSAESIIEEILKSKPRGTK